jgi:hypothetical protein
VGGNLTLTGQTGTDKKVLLRSTTDGTTYNVAVTGLPSANYVDVKDSIATPKEILANNSTLLNTTGWIAPAANDVYWINASGDGLWSTAANWSTGAVPGTTSNVYFSATSTSSCSFDSLAPDTAIASLTLNAGYTGTLSLTKDITVTGTITVNGGNITDNGKNVNFVNVSVGYASSRITSTSPAVWKMTGNGTAINAYHPTNAFYKFEVAAGVVCTIQEDQVAIQKQLIQRANSRIDMKVVRPTGSSPAIIVFKYGQKGASSLDNPIVQEDGASIVGTGGNNMQRIVFYDSTITNLNIRSLTFPYGYVSVDKCDTSISGTWDYTITGTNSSLFQFASIGGTLNLGSAIINVTKTSGTDGFSLFHYANGSSASTLNLGAATINASSTGSAVLSIFKTGASGGTLNPGTATINLSTSSTAGIKIGNGSNPLNLTNLNVSNSAGKTVYFNNLGYDGVTPMVYNVANLSMQGASGNNLMVRSVTDGTAYKLNVTGAATGMQYLDVKDSDSSGGNSIVAMDSISTGSNNKNWAFPGPGDHLGFASGAPAAQAGVSFNLPKLVAQDVYHNALTNYSGAKTIAYTLSGSSNSPDGNDTDSFTTAVNFTNGESTTALATTLYRAQTTTVTPSDAANLTGTNSASDVITVNPNTATKIAFKQQPSSTAVINAPFTRQPIVAIRDMYGNQTTDTFSIQLFPSATSEPPFGDAGGILTSSHVDNTLAATAGAAAFAGVNYANAGELYLYAEALGGGSELTAAFSTAVNLATAQTTVVEAAASPVANFNLTPTFDTLAEKFEVLKFKISDKGSDNIPTMIDRINVAVGGTGANASTDIAWAGLYADGVKVADASAIANDTITFGTAPNGGGAADLYDLDDNSTTEFTVYIYMKAGKLTSTEGQTYTFTTNENNIGVDTGGETSGIAANTASITTVTGTVTVLATHLGVVTAATGDTEAALTAGTPAELSVRATDANKNVDINYGGNRSLVFSGLGGVGIYNPLIEAKTFGSTTTINFTQGVSATNAVTLTAYKKEIGTVVVQENTKSYIQNGLVATVSAGAANAIAVGSGNNQSGRISWPLADTFVALVSDQYGNGVAAGTAVNFAIASQPNGASGAGLSTISGFTDSNGQVATTFTVGSAAGAYQVTAASTGLNGSPVTFTATGLSPSAIQIASGNNQSKQIAMALDNPLVVKVVDPTGIAIPNETVNFTILSYPDGATGQALSVSSATTNASGLAQVVLTLGTRTGDYKVAVSSGSLPAIELTATATPGGPYQVVLSGPGSVKAGQVSTVYTITTQDASGNSSNLSTSTVFSLTTSPVRANGVFYSNSDGTGVITSLTVTSGTSSANFYYKDTTTGTANLVATRTSGQALTVTNSSQAVTIMPADAFLYKVTGSTATIATGGTKALTITAYDNQGNVKNDYTGDMNVVFSGATASPAPAAKKATASNKTSQDIDFGQTTVLSFSSGVATTTAKFYNVEGVTVKAASGTVETATEDALSFIVKHGAANHLKFSGNLPSPQAAGTEFNFDTELNAVDLYDNLCDGANGASAFSGSPQVGWALSGTSNGPEGNVTDEFVSPVTFSGGVSSTLLKAKLYYAQNTTITASTAALTGTNVASNIITVNSGAASKLTWAPQPAAAGVTTQALTIQPKVTVSDQYGNPVSGSSAGVTLTASLTTGTFTPVVNGSLSATSGLTVATVNGVAAFAGLTYSFPETIYLRATVSGVDMTPLYSWGVNFATAPDGAFAAGAAGATQISSLAYTAADKVGVLNFKITDGGTDGFATKIKQLILKRNTADTTGGWSSFLKGAYISDGAAQFVGTIEDNQIIFGLGTDDIYSVTNGTVKNFTVSVYLKNPLPVDSDNKVLSFKLDPTTDILLGSPSSTLAAASALTASPILAVVATDFVVSGNTTMNAGDTQAITLKVTDALGNLDKDYSGEKILVFSGANVSFKGNAPIETTTQNLFGDPTPVAFTAGQSSTQVGIQLFTAETAYIKATENSAGVTTANKNALIVRVAGGTATGLSWLIQPAAAVVEEASLKEFSVVVVDAYGNTSSSSADVTVVPSSGELCAGASGTVAAQQGIATFYNFAVKNLADGEIITLSGTANGLTGTGASSEILVSKKYTVVLNVKDSVTQGGLNNVILTITNSDTGELVTIPTHSSPWTGNSPFKDNFKLPAGAYTLSLEREEYVANSKDVVAGAAQDGMDGTYDNKLTWDIYMTSIAESMADYKGIADFVYDEDTDALNITQRLERRGQQKVSDGINNLGVATIEIFDGSDKIGTLTANPDAQGNYWYAIPNVTSVAPTGNYVVGSFTKPLMNGKTYFARCLIFYGGTTGDKTSYGSGTTFTITVTQRLSKEIINSLGVYPGGETLATRLDNVKAGVTAVSSKVDTTSAAVTAKVETVGTQVSAVNANVSTTGTKIDTVQGTVGVIQTDVTKTLPAKILADMEKGVMSEMLTRNTILREDDEVKIRYRTASGLAPVLTIITPDGTALPDYNGVKMTEINKTGIYEYSVTAKEDWGIGDFTVECSEPTKGSKDSMVLTVKALYTAGAGVQESVDAVGEAVSKVYTRQKGIEGLLGTVKDPQSAKTIFAKMNTVNSKLDSYNLTGVSSDARDAKQNAENVYNEIKSLTSGMSDLKAQATAVKQLSSQLEEMRSNLAKASKSLTSAGGSGGGEVVMASGGGSTGVGGEAGSGVGLNASNERELAAFLKDAKAKKSGITESESKDLNNKIEELTALVKVLGQMVQNTNNKPIVEGWFEQG